MEENKKPKISVREKSVNVMIKEYPKVQLGFNHVMVTTNKKEVSGLITSPSSLSENRDPFLLDVQEVLAVGPHSSDEKNGINLKKGDKVLLDTRKLQAKNALVLQYSIDNETGELITLENEDKFKGTEQYNVMLITDREVLLKFI